MRGCAAAAYDPGTDAIRALVGKNITQIDLDKGQLLETAFFDRHFRLGESPRQYYT